MWTVSWTACRISAARVIAVTSISAFSSAVAAQTINPNNTTYFNSTSVTHGLYLPSVTVPHGSDEVRAGDGTTCRSSLASNSGYLDLGAVGNQDPTRDALSASIYGRVIVPLGQKPERLNCRALYRLEVDRLRHELELARMGANSFSAPSGVTQSGHVEPWEKDGWRDHRQSDRNWQRGTSIHPNARAAQR